MATEARGILVAGVTSDPANVASYGVLVAGVVSQTDVDIITSKGILVAGVTSDPANVADHGMLVAVVSGPEPPPPPFIEVGEPFPGGPIIEP